MTGPDKLLPHESDGIQEYDNPNPGWWMWSLYGSIVFAIGYMFFYGMNFGGTVEAEDAAATIEATAEVQAWLAKNPMVPPSKEELLAAAVDPAILSVGKEQFDKTCAACHGLEAQGLIGPNLTDTAWIHGGGVTDIWNTIVKGVPAKGMPTWRRSFKPEVLTALAAYVRSVQGTAPAGAKIPEGTESPMEPLPAPNTP